MTAGTGFKLLLAVSADGYLAKGPDDDMRWTGRDDKAIFKLLTSAGGVLLAGSRTAALMPTLPGRPVVPISRRPQHGLTLQEAAWAHRDAWLIGGSTIAMAALDANLVERAFICCSPTPLLMFPGEGVPFAPLEERLGFHVQVKCGDVLVKLYTGLNKPRRLRKPDGT